MQNRLKLEHHGCVTIPLNNTKTSLLGIEPKSTAPMSKSVTVLIAAAIVLVSADYVEAQASIARIDQVSESFRVAVSGIAGTLSTIARNLMLSLLLIELIWKLGQAVWEGDDFGKLMSLFFKRIVVAGFFLAIVDGIPTGSGQVGFGSFIIQSAEALTSSSVGASDVRPSDLFWQMLRAGKDIYDGSSGISGTIGSIIVWLLLVLLGAVIAGLMVVAYIEIYVIFTVGILSLGFGVWSVTEQFAKNFMFSAVGKILKLFTMILMASVVTITIKDFGALTEFEDGLVTIGIVLIFAMLLTTVPTAVEQIISGIPGVSADSAVAGTMMGGAKSVGGKVVQGGINAGGNAASSAVSKAGFTKENAGRIASGIAGRIRSIKKGT